MTEITLALILASVKESYKNTASQFKFALRRGTLEPTIWERLAFLLALGVTLVFALFPFYIMIMTSVLPDNELYQLPPTLIPSVEALTTTHYDAVFGGETFPFIRYMRNSFLVAVSTAGIGVGIAVFGAYSFARLHYPGQSVISRLVLVVYMFSGILLVVPLFQIMVKIGLVDTLYSLLITYLVKVLPLSLYMLGNYFRGIPEQIEEAALIDGYSRPETILRITIPLSAPAIVAVFLYAFMISWNEYLFASIFLKSRPQYTLPIGIESLTLSFHNIWGQVMAASLLTSLPVIVMFIYLEKFMIQGLTHGAVEG